LTAGEAPLDGVCAILAAGKERRISGVVASLLTLKTLGKRISRIASISKIRPADYADVCFGTKRTYAPTATSLVWVEQHLTECDKNDGAENCRKEYGREGSS
jgi:hypothetical protein